LHEYTFILQRYSGKGDPLQVPLPLLLLLLLLLLSLLQLLPFTAMMA